MEGIMGRTSRLLKRAIELIKAKKFEDARLVLNAVFREEPNNWRAWAWYVETCAGDDERIAALENLLRINPNSQGGQKQLLALLRKRNTELKSSPPSPIPKIALERTRRRAAWRLVLIGLALLMLGSLAWNVQASKQIKGLTGENDRLNASYSSLFQDHVGLQNKYDTSRLEHDQLGLNYRDLQNSHTQLQNGYAQLQVEFAGLQTNFEDLRSQYDLLNQQFSSLESKAIVPPYIYIRGRDVWTAFEKSNGQIIYWKTAFDGLETDLQRGNNIRADINRERAMIRNGQGNLISADRWLTLTYPRTEQSFYVVDERIFVDRNEFAKVIPELYAQAPSEAEFIHEIWNIIAQLTIYSAEITDTPRYPLETLLAGGGDCEDTAILLASMILAAPVNWDVYLVYMDAYFPYDPVEMNHVIVYIETDQSYYYVETTSKTAMNPYQDKVNGWYYKINE